MQIFNPYKTFRGAFIPNAIMECRDLTQSAKLMWGRLAQYAGENGRCYPSIRKVGNDIGLSRSAAKKVIDELRDYGLIIVKVSGGNNGENERASNEYLFVFHDIFKQSGKSSKNDSDDCEELCQGGTAHGTGGVPHTVRGGTADGTGGVPHTVYKKRINERESLRTTSGSGNTSPDDGSKKKKKFYGSDEDHALAHKIYEAVLVVNATIKTPNWDTWANEIRLMREIDGRTHDEIWRVFCFANRDQFWCHNILSPAAIRRQFSRLAPKSGMVKSQVRGVTADVPEIDETKTCGQCGLAGKGKMICGGADADPDHPACELFQPVKQ